MKTDHMEKAATAEQEPEWAVTAEWAATAAVDMKHMERTEAVDQMENPWALSIPMVL